MEHECDRPDVTPTQDIDDLIFGDEYLLTVSQR